MKRIKNALVAILSLIRAAILKILIGLGFVAGAVYLGVVGLAVLFMGVQALGLSADVFAVIGFALGAAVILFTVRVVNQRADPRFVNASVATPDGPPESGRHPALYRRVWHLLRPLFHWRINGNRQ